MQSVNPTVIGHYPLYVTIGGLIYCSFVFNACALAGVSDGWLRASELGQNPLGGFQDPIQMSLAAKCSFCRPGITRASETQTALCNFRHAKLPDFFTRADE